MREATVASKIALDAETDPVIASMKERHVKTQPARDASRLPFDRDEPSSALLGRVRDAADVHGWETFWRRYEPMLLAYVCGRGLHEHDARDVVQEIFARLHRALPSFQLDRERGRFRTWLRQVASNALADWWHGRERQRLAEREWRDRRSAARPDGANALEVERRLVLEHALRRLREQSQPKSWICFEQRVLLARPSAAIAAELGLTPNAVNVNAARALARLRKLCASTGEEARDVRDILPGGA